MAERESGGVETWRRRPAWLVPLGIAAAAVLFRLFLGHEYQEFGGDAPQYTALAKNLAAGHGYAFAHSAPYVASDIRLPGYPVLLAVPFLFSHSQWSVIILNALLGGIATFLVWLIADGLKLSRPRALWCTGIAAVWLSTASMAGSALTENLSVPAVLAFVYFMLIRPPQRRLWLFVLGSALAWVIALTREELMIFAVIVAVIAGRRAHLKAVAIAGLALCFLAGSFAWVARNEVQVHRVEYVDSVQSDAVIVASMTGGHNKLEKESQALLLQPSISTADRKQYQQKVYTYVDHQLSHNLPAVITSKAKYELESFFPVPIFGLTYKGQNKELARAAWSLLILLEYIFAVSTARRWWRSKRRPDVVSLFVFPVFIVLFEVVFDPQFRFILPVNLLLLPPAVEAVGTWFDERKRRRPPSAPKSSEPAAPVAAADMLKSKA